MADLASRGNQRCVAGMQKDVIKASDDPDGASGVPMVLLGVADAF
jgi:hypothetical protein